MTNLRIIVFLGTQGAAQRLEFPSSFCFQKRCLLCRFSKPTSEWRTRSWSKRTVGCSSSMARYLCSKIPYLRLQQRCFQGHSPQNKPDHWTNPRLPNDPEQVKILNYQVFLFNVEIDY